MPRIPRGQVAGHAYHVLIRGNGGAAVFHKDGDYTAFLDWLATAKAKYPVKVFGFCLMPNHFHLAVQPATDAALSPFMQWWMTSHLRRYHRHYRNHGHVWQGRVKCFPIQQDAHLLTVPPLRAPQSCPRGAGRAREGLALVEPAIPASERSRSRRDTDRVAPVD
jgi:putative transposase